MFSHVTNFSATGASKEAGPTAPPKKEQPLSEHGGGHPLPTVGGALRCYINDLSPNLMC